MFLAEILAWKREEIKKRARQRPDDSLWGEITVRSGNGKSLSSALKIPGPAIVAEIKRASPSQGVFAPQLIPEKLAAVYAENGAAALSVLTDERYFKGSLDDLRAVRTVADLPILRKDFIIDPYQILEAKWAGADAILLIMAALSREQAMELRACAREFGLEVLVEVHKTVEVEAALALEPEVLGINNRDLETFKVSLEVTKELRPVIHAQARAKVLQPGSIQNQPKPVIPTGGFPVISESGIRSRQDIVSLCALGIDGFLIGETLVKSGDPGKTLRELREDDASWQA
jgi:indole-3-glycerol phosphate synthase